MTRVLHWPEALAAEIAFAQDQRYELGVHDCLRFTCRCIEVMTGANYWPRFAGYTTKRQALVTIARIAPSLGEAVSLVLDQPMQPAPFAHRGDVVLYRDAGGEHLGICTGATAAVLGESSLAFVRLDHPGIAGAWRVD